MIAGDYAEVRVLSVGGDPPPGVIALHLRGVVGRKSSQLLSF
jgi:hypothetical protein